MTLIKMMLMMLIIITTIIMIMTVLTAITVSPLADDFPKFLLTLLLRVSEFRNFFECIWQLQTRWHLDLLGKKEGKSNSLFGS